MSSFPFQALTASLRQTVAFRTMPAMTRPSDETWLALNTTLLQLRPVLYADRLGKKPATPKARMDAIDAAIDILSAFAVVAGTTQAIVSLENGMPLCISFQPRPAKANWTREHAISPPSLAAGITDPMTQDGHRPEVSTPDMLHLAAKVAQAIAIQMDARYASATVTFQFARTPEEGPYCHYTYKPH